MKIKWSIQPINKQNKHYFNFKYNYLKPPHKKTLSKYFVKCIIQQLLIYSIIPPPLHCTYTC